MVITNFIICFNLLAIIKTSASRILLEAIHFELHGLLILKLKCVDRRSNWSGWLYIYTMG